MPALLKNYIDLGYLDGAYAYADILNAQADLVLAGNYIEAEEWALANGSIRDAASLIATFASSLLSDDIWKEGLRGHWRDALYWINDNWPSNGPAEVTMQAILDAMWGSIGGQTMTFISYIDAMRGSISEKTVFEPYLASYMRHFLEQ